MAYIPETVMNCDVDYVNKPEKYKCLGNTKYLSGFFLAIVEMSSGFRSSCYWTDWNWANTENIRIGLVFAGLAQLKFLYCIDRFDHIKANKSKLINKT